jgi:hypothetical protein
VNTYASAAGTAACAACAPSSTTKGATGATQCIPDGLSVSYYDLKKSGNPSRLPDFAKLTPIAGRPGVALDVNFATTSGAFAGSGLEESVGAVFVGDIYMPAAGDWTSSSGRTTAPSSGSTARWSSTTTASSQ